MLNNNGLQKSLKIRVFSTNFAVGCQYASYERHFVKKIQHLFLIHRAYLPFYKSCFDTVFFVVKISSFNERVGHCLQKVFWAFGFI